MKRQPLEVPHDSRLPFEGSVIVHLSPEPDH